MFDTVQRRCSAHSWRQRHAAAWIRPTPALLSSSNIMCAREHFSLRLFNLQSSKARNTSSQPRDRIKDGLEGEQWVDVLLDAKQCVDIVVDMLSAHTCDYCRLHGDARNERTMLQLDIETLKDRARRLPGVPETALAKFMRAMNSMAYGASGVGSLYDVVDDVCSHVLTPSLLSPCLCFRSCWWWSGSLIW